MRKLTMEYIPNEEMKKEMKPLFDIIISYEILESLKIDWEEGVCVDLIEFQLNEGVSINGLKFIGVMEILSVLKSEGNKHTCLVKSQNPEETMDEYREFDLNLIYTTPFIISKEKHTFSVIGDQKSLMRFIELIKRGADSIVNMSFKRAAYQRHDILTVLTDKQKEVLIAARKHGYYKYPRKIQSGDLAQKIGISKATTVEHLRKAEERLMENILDGY